MTETRECLRCGQEFQVVRHPLDVCPTCEDEVQAKLQHEQRSKRRTNWNSVLSWVGFVCGLVGMALALLAYLR